MIENGVMIGLLIIPLSGYVNFMYDKIIETAEWALGYLIVMVVVIIGIYGIIYNGKELSSWINGGEYRKLKEIKLLLEDIQVYMMDQDEPKKQLII